MQVVTTVKTTMSEIKKALQLLNPNLPTEFVLDIDIECNAEAYKVSSVEQDTEGWIDVPKDWKLKRCPTDLDTDTEIDVIQRNGVISHNLCGTNVDTYISNLWSQDNHYADIVKYRLSRNISSN